MKETKKEHLKKKKHGFEGKKKQKKLEGTYWKEEQKTVIKAHQYQGSHILNALPDPQLNELLKDPNQSYSY